MIQTLRLFVVSLHGCLWGTPPCGLDAAPPVNAQDFPKVSVLVPLLAREEEIAGALMRDSVKPLPTQGFAYRSCWCGRGDQMTPRHDCAHELPFCSCDRKVPSSQEKLAHQTPRLELLHWDFCNGKHHRRLGRERCAEARTRLDRVVTNIFERAPQKRRLRPGVLDYYKRPDPIGSSRCFALEYASWVARYSSGASTSGADPFR